MGEDKRISRKDLVLICLIACIVSLSIAYATISATLTISNNLTVKAHDWDIHFENLEQESITGGNSATVISPAKIEQDTTRISGLQATFKQPGDKVVYTFDVTNAGEIDARLDSIAVGTPTCSPQSDICNDLEFTLKYANGNSISQDDVLNAGDTVSLKLTINYKAASSTLVTDDITVNGLDATLVYSQK